MNSHQHSIDLIKDIFTVSGVVLALSLYELTINGTGEATLQK